MVVELRTSSEKNAHKEVLSFIKCDEFDKRLTLDYGTSTGEGVTVGDSVGSGESSPTNKCLLVIDLRSFFQYQESHVRQSINLTNSPLVSKRIQDGKLQIKEYLEARVMFDGTQDVVVYEQSGCTDRRMGQDAQEGTECNSEGQEGSGVTDFAKLIFLNLTKVKCDQAKIEILRGGFDSFRKKYPKHCTQGLPFVNRFVFTNNNDDEMAFLNWQASEIRNNIYVGALHDAQDDKLLDRLGITHILNCCKTDSRPEMDRNEDYGAKYQYLQLMCDDNLQQSLDSKLEPAFKLIDSAVLNAGDKVLIHCYAGISRSAAITMAYMMHKLDMSYEQSYRELKLKRSIVAPNINFVSQLMKFDEEKKNLILQKKMQSEKKCTLVAAAPTALKLNRNGVEGGASGLASKRKMMLHLPLKLYNTNNVNPLANVAASAPVMSPYSNPFAAAFKKANSNQCTENIEAPFERKLDILLE